MAGVARPRVRRDIVLDSGGLTRLAAGDQYAQEWIKQLGLAYNPPVFLVPQVIMTEVTTGFPGADVRVHRFLRQIDDPEHLGAFWLPVDEHIASRAGVLRTLALAARDPEKRPISGIDAQVAALAEARSVRNGVTVLTTDPTDIKTLIDVITPRPRNIAVESV